MGILILSVCQRVKTFLIYIRSSSILCVQHPQVDHRRTLPQEREKPSTNRVNSSSQPPHLIESPDREDLRTDTAREEDKMADDKTYIPFWLLISPEAEKKDEGAAGKEASKGSDGKKDKSKSAKGAAKGSEASGSGSASKAT